jgi:phosphoribosylformimino-5-aminoimidazole carboxamide ribotide isomerase
MQIIPVIDVYHDRVVRGVGGRRDEYLPIQSRITSSADPLEAAFAFRDRFGLTTLYVADLDAIVDRRPHLELYRSLARAGFQSWVDAGVRSVVEAEVAADWGAETVIVGLESCPTPSLLPELIGSCGADRLLFSLDLRNGKPIAPTGWPALTAPEIAAAAIDAGFRRLLVLDLKDVGTGSGGGTDALLHEVRTSSPQITLVAGGGVRGVDDLQRLSRVGVDAVLVASALHDGRLSREDVIPWT